MSPGIEIRQLRLRFRGIALALVSVLLSWPTRLPADQAAEIALVHVEAIGGRERIGALKSYRATGHLVADGRAIGLTVTAARPAKLRVELQYDNRRVIQGSDGSAPPWELDTSERPPRSKPMPATRAGDFLTEAEFDDPLIAPSENDCAIDFAGEQERDGRKFIRLLVTQRLTKTFHLLLDPATYLIVWRIERTAAGTMATHYSEFRPVAGVLSPHRIAVTMDGGISQEAILEHIEANPALPAGFFSRP